jgi:energy-coupling factor transporter ATP-binding protein EcfA2
MSDSSASRRKRVTIAEAALAGAPLQCWDNSTRGLDSANAVEFCRNLRVGAEYTGTTSVVAIYQAPQSAYDIFDKVCVLYEGEQIFFGRATAAKAFFEAVGFECPPQQTVPDFLTSLTSPGERKARAGFENRVPQTPQEFAAVWKKSAEYARLKEEIAAFENKHPVNSERYEEFLKSRRAQQSKHMFVPLVRRRTSLSDHSTLQSCRLAVHHVVLGSDQALPPSWLLAFTSRSKSDTFATIRQLYNGSYHLVHLLQLACVLHRVTEAERG